MKSVKTAEKEVITMKLQFRLKIGAKLIGLLAVLLIVSTVTLVWASNRLFIDDSTALIQQLNSDTAGNLAGQLRELFANISDKTRLMGSLFLQDPNAAKTKAAIFRDVFANDPDFLAFLLHETGPGNPTIRGQAFSESFKEADMDSEALIASAQSGGSYSLLEAAKGTAQIGALKLSDGTAAFAITLPFVKSATTDAHFSYTVTGVFRQGRLQKVFSENDIVSSFVVDRAGRYLAHSAQTIQNGDSATQIPIVNQMLEGKMSNGQTSYFDPALKERRLGAFHRVGFAGVGIVSEVPEAKAFEAARRVQFRAGLVALIILALSFLAGYFYSDTITWPIQQLVLATRKISAGDFTVRMHTRSKDEVGELSVAFNEMASGLEERERVKATFTKFHNKEIAEKLLSGDVALGGERREATVFFSDIRGFTKLSESMQPEQVVEMLNEYMTCMVAVIRKHGGIVDKYVGDAIMALWGVPLDSPDANFHAISACLEMRIQLARFNEKRIARKLPPLLIGMGLNSGPVIAGNIGSNEKMEYTVIGDTVNLASRIESMTKEFGTDLLIARNVRDKVADRFVFEACQSVKVKGKSQVVETFKVLGPLVNGKPTLVATPYSEYAPEVSEKIEHSGKAA